MADAQTEVEALRAQLNAIQEAGQRAALSAGIATAIQSGGFDLHAGASEQIQHLLRGDVQVFREGDQLVPVGPGLAPLTSFVASKLATLEYAHFHKSGKAPASPTSSVYPNVAPLPVGAAPRNLGEAAIMTVLSRAKPATDARFDLSSPMGLRGI